MIVWINGCLFSKTATSMGRQQNCGSMARITIESSISSFGQYSLHTTRCFDQTNSRVKIIDN